MQLPFSTPTHQRNELASLLPSLLTIEPTLLAQLQKYYITHPDIELACYELYDQHGIDPLLEIHPMRESFYQMELSNDKLGEATLSEQPPTPIKENSKKATISDNPKDYILLSKNHLQLFMAVALFVLLLLRLLPKP